MIRNIVFDMGGVLVHYNTHEIIARLELPPEDRDALMRETFGSVEWVQLDRGSISQEDAVAAMKARLPRRLHAAVDRLYTWWELDLRPMEGMEELLAELKELGYGLYLLSNATVRQPEYFGKLGFNRYLDGGVVSAFFKVLKPQKEIFDVLLRKYDLRAEECFFVDDYGANVESARFFGMPGAVFYGDVPRLRRELNAAGVPVKAG